jgi:hypothetical protein
METVAIIVVCGILLAMLGGYLWTVSWAIGDATKRGHGRGHVLFLFWLFGPLAALVWLIVRPTHTLVERGAHVYASADDAIAAASRLDSIGELDAAIELLQTVVERWPDYRAYAVNCISAIERKRDTVNA